MIKSEFSEKVYEIFINHELLSNGYIIYAPSQRKEKSLGYDALCHMTKGSKIKAIALQYKIVWEYENPPFPLSYPSFRFDLHKSSTGKYTQHNIMVKRNTSISQTMPALYCVPKFIDYKSLYKNLQSGTLLQNSCLIMPFDEIIDSEYHCIKFDNTLAFQCSNEPREIKIFNVERVFEAQEPISFEGFIKRIATQDNQTEPFEQLNECLAKTHSFLLLKTIPN